MQMLPHGSAVVASASMPEVVYRRLGRDGATRLCEMDRSEVIEGVYRMEGDDLVLGHERRELFGWPPGFLEKETVIQLAIHDRGGALYGAFFGDRLVGYMSLDSRPVCGRIDRLLLDMLQVDSHFRGRGIGCRLLEHAKSLARDGGGLALRVGQADEAHGRVLPAQGIRPRGRGGPGAAGALPRGHPNGPDAMTGPRVSNTIA